MPHMHMAAHLAFHLLAMQRGLQRYCDFAQLSAKPGQQAWSSDNACAAGMCTQVQPEILQSTDLEDVESALRSCLLKLQYADATLAPLTKGADLYHNSDLQWPQPFSLLSGACRQVERA